MPAIPDGLPPWANAIATLIFLSGFGLTIWKSVNKSAPPADAQNAIIAGDIMATKPMADLAKAVEKLDPNLHLYMAAMDRAAAASDRAAVASDRAAEASHRTEHAIADLCIALRDKT